MDEIPPLGFMTVMIRGMSYIMTAQAHTLVCLECVFHHLASWSSFCATN